jgi:UDP-N-acetylglucosamine 1-carboxyvinyltransferase
MSALARTRIPGTIQVAGGVQLSGHVRVDGSKNAALPLLAAAAVLPAGPVDLERVPACVDVQAMTGLLVRAGWPVQAGGAAGDVRVGRCSPGLTQPVLAEASRIRASYYLVPALIAAYGSASLPWPGGCSVGDRGMDLHFRVYEAFGDTVETGPAGYAVRAASGRARGTVRIGLPFRSRGATVAALLRAVAADRPIVIGNPNLCAEVRALYRALAAAGCAVEVTAGQVSMQPGDHGPVRWTVPGDKIEAGTLACAIAATGGSGQIQGIPPGDVAPLAEALRLLGLPAIASARAGGTLEVPAGWHPSGRPLGVHASLEPGGLDADWEPGLLVLALGLPGCHQFSDPVNPGRHANLIPQLRAMGAVITETSATACTVRGPQALAPAVVHATDIRTGSALLIAALAADGVTVINGVTQLRRGHADLPGTLRDLGARITGDGEQA